MHFRTCFNSLGEGCGRTLPLDTDHFWKDRVRDGVQTFRHLCKPCARAKLREWKAANPHKVSANNRRDHSSHRDERIAADRAYYQANAEHLKEVSRNYSRNLTPEQRARAAARSTASKRRRHAEDPEAMRTRWRGAARRRRERLRDDERRARQAANSD